jgi:hypothetical protein
MMPLICAWIQAYRAASASIVKAMAAMAAMAPCAARIAPTPPVNCTRLVAAGAGAGVDLPTPPLGVVGYGAGEPVTVIGQTVT